MGVKIDYKQVTNRDEAFQKTKAFFTPEYLEKLQVKFDLTFDEEKKVVKAAGSGFTLLISFFEKHCDVDLDLSLIFRPLKAKILEKIQSQIERNL